LEAEGLKVRLGARTVVRNVSLRVRRGEIVGLLGPNGAGKTTVFRMLVGLLRPDAGRVTLFGEDILHEPFYLRARRGLQYLAQEPTIFRGLTVEQNVMAVLERQAPRSSWERDRVPQLLDQLGLAALAKQRADTLSGGERRRLEIARALAGTPTLFLLDEPLVGVDPKTVQDFLLLVRALRDKGFGILLTDHLVHETLSVCDRAYLMLDGSVVLDGTPEELNQSALARERYFGTTYRGGAQSQLHSQPRSQPEA